MSAPLVSVLLPSYDYGRFLPEALDSVLAQSLDDLEIVAIDDASSDDSPAILRRYAEQDGRVRLVLRDANVGMVTNWNDCLSAARGRYVQFLFADDALAGTDALGRLVALLENDDAAAIAVGSRTVVDEHSRPLRTRGYAPRDTSERGADVIARCAGAGRNLIGEPDAVMFRREDAARGFDPSFRQLVDLEMWCHLLRGGSLRFTAAPVCRFRRHDAQQSSVNRGSGVHESELARLLERYVDTVGQLDDRRLLAGWSYRLRRADGPPDAIAAVDRRLGPVAPLSRLAFRLARPLENLERRRWG